MKFFKDCLIGGAISLVGWIVLISLIVLLINNIEELSIMNKLEITKKDCITCKYQNRGSSNNYY